MWLTYHAASNILSIKLLMNYCMWYTSILQLYGLDSGGLFMNVSHKSYVTIFNACMTNMKPLSACRGLSMLFVQNLIFLSLFLLIVFVQSKWELGVDSISPFPSFKNSFCHTSVSLTVCIHLICGMSSLVPKKTAEASSWGTRCAIEFLWAFHTLCTKDNVHHLLLNFCVL